MADATTTATTAATAATTTAGTSSTPTTAAAATDASATTTSTQAATTATDATKSTEGGPGAQSTQTAAATTDGTQSDTTAVQPLFTLPKDSRLAPETVTAFESALKPMVGADGKMTLTPQALVDLFLGQAQAADTRWQKSLETLNQTNEATCKQRFSAQQLAAAERAVGFLSSFDPEFREVAKIQLNHPAFVNAMRVVGERLSEDTFEMAGNPSPALPRTRAEKAQILYGKKAS